MFLLIGERIGGVVDRVEDAHIETRFFHVGLLPVVPLRSYLVARSDRRAIPRHLRFIVAGYLRGWSPVLVAGAAVTGVVADGVGTALWGIMVVIAALTWIVARVLGGLAPFDLALCAAYKRHLGAPVEPADLGEDLGLLRERAAAVVDRALPVSPAGYRSAAPRASAWVDELLASEPDEDDLAAAVTRTRVEELLGSAPGREDWRAARRRLLRRYVERHPEGVDRALGLRALGG